MVNKQKQKGSAFESKATDILNTLVTGGDFRRVPGSGAMGTALGEPLLTADIKGTVKNFPKSIRVECKTGYSNRTGGETKSFTLQKQWIDKIGEEARNSFSFPVLLAHFDGARVGTKNVAILDINDFAELINMYTALKKELDMVYGSK